MLLLITASTYPASLEDGTPRFVHDLAAALTQHAEVHVVAPGAPGAPRDESMGPVDVHRFTYFWPSRYQCLTPGIVDNLSRSWLARIQLPSFLIAGLVATWRHVRRHRPDVLNAHWLVPQGLFAAVIRSLVPGFRIVLHVHAGDVDLLARLPLGRSVARFVVRRADAVFTASSQVRDRLEEVLGHPSGGRVRSMGVDLERFAGTPAAASPFPGGYLLFIGRLVPKKGLTYLLQAMRMLSPDHPELGLVIVGDGPDRTNLERETRELGLGDRVVFIGPQSHGVVAGYLAGARAVVVPSIVDDRGETEGLPTVIVEAMASGAPVISTAVAGIPEIVVNGDTGWLCPPRNPAALAAAANEVLAGTGVGEIVARARVRAADYTWDAVAADYLDMLGRRLVS